MHNKSFAYSIARTYNRLKSPSCWGSVTKAVVFNPVDFKFVLTSIDGKDYMKALRRGRVVGSFDNNVKFNDLRDECRFVFKEFYPEKMFRYHRPL